MFPNCMKKKRFKSFIYVRLSHLNCFVATQPNVIYMRINKQLINLVYNGMKNLTYSLICFNGVQSVF